MEVEKLAPAAGATCETAGGTGAALVMWTFSVADGRLRTLSAETARTL